MKDFIILLTIFFIYSYSECSAQKFKNERDSLQYEIRNSDSTFTIASAHGRLAWLLAYSDLQSAFAHLDTAFQLFEEIENEDQIAIINYKYGTFHRVSGDYEKAHIYIDEFDQYAKNKGDTAKIANSLFQKGVIFSLQGDYENGLKEYYKTLSLYETLRDSAAMGFTLNSIGIVYKNLKKYSLGIESFERAISIHEKMKDLKNLPNAYSNLGNLYATQKEYDKALEYFNKALSIDIETNNSWGASINTLDIGWVLIEKGEYVESLVYLNDAYEIQKKYNYRNELAETLSKMGEAWFKIGNYAKSEEILLEALKQSTSSFLINKQIHFTLFELFEQTKKYKKSLNHHRKYTAYNDSIFEEENLKNIHVLQFQYETEKKDIAIALNNLELEHNKLSLAKKNSQLIVATAGGFILINISLGLWVYFRQRQKIKSKEILRLEGQQEIIQLEALIAGEEKERNRLAQDLHDGINGDLAVIKYKVSSIEDSKLNSKEKVLYNEAIDMLDNSVEQIRRISHNLAPPSLHNFDLVEAIQQFCSKLNTSNKVNISFQYFGDRLVLEKEKETAIYRIIQESLNNVIKHSGATEALVQINKHDDKLHLTIEDNGKGFDTEAKSNGIGLHNIKSRVSFLNATLDICSSSLGTSFSIEIDLKNKQE